ncbi:MAG TPA: hypothetical protein VGB57_09035 [Allosphingosinicella sp.]
MSSILTGSTISSPNGDRPDPTADSAVAAHGWTMKSLLVIVSGA